MKEVYSKEEIAVLAEYLNFKSPMNFRSFLAFFNDFPELNSDELSNEEFSSMYQEFYTEKMKEVKDRLGIEDDLSNLSTEEKALIIISVTKEMGKDYILSLYKDKIDEDIAEKMVEYGYTHGSCYSLAYTLCALFKDECQIKIFTAGSYAHQCVLINGKYFDIRGCSTEEEMKEFVAKEGGVSVEDCVIEDCRVIESKHKLLDYIITKNIDKVICLEDEKEME